MKQIDILISDQQKEYLDREQSLRTQLQRQERELSTMRVAVQEKNAEVWISEDNLACKHLYECFVVGEDEAAKRWKY